MAAAEHLVGRAAELGSFGQLLSDLESGRSATIELVGEPGIGKTRLLAELAARADERGLLVLGGCASELESDLPFWVFVDALDEFVQGLDPHRLDALGDDVKTELAHVLPSLSRPAAGDGGALQHERYRSHRAVRELLEVLAAGKPLVLVLDDLHWADPASVELLGALLRRPPDAALLTALAVRPRQVPERLAAVLERAHRSGSLERVELEALSKAEAQELLGPAAAETAGLYETSGGNPFYLEQLARSLARAPANVAGPGVSLEGVEVPQGVAAALAEELALLSENARRVLEGAAVAGDPFEPELAAAASASTDVEAIEALDELLRLDLVRPTDVPRRFRFRHPIVRRTVYETTPGGWRLAAHERCAEALAKMGISARARAHHVEYSARPGDLVAIATLREAGEATAHRAPASAERWFSAALRLLPESAPAEERVELLLARSGALAATGRFADSHAVLLESSTIAPDDAVGLRVRLVAATAGVEHLLGRHQQAHARLESALAKLDDSDSAEAVALMIELAVDSLYRGAYAEMSGWAERAVSSAESLGDRPLTAAAFAVRTLAAALSGAVAAARAYRVEASEFVDALSDEELARRLDALAHLATAEMYLDLFEHSGRHAARALEIGRATGQGDLFPLIFPMLGTSLWVQGRLAESAEVFDGAIEHARLLENVQALAWNLFNRSFAALAAGDVDLAFSTARESVELAKHLDESVITGHAAWGLAAALLETGRAAEAAELLLASTGGEELTVIPGGWRANGLWLLTRCLLEAGRRTEAERAAAAAGACADALGLPMATAMARLAEATLDLDDGAGSRAAGRALDAAAALAEVGDAYHAAQARMLAGRALAQAGERERALDEFERAANAFVSFGADRYRAEAERELRKLGRTVHHRTRAGTGDGGLASLTERELELARLVVDRKTNPQIAAELFLSQKTVETHLRNIFRKVGVANRVELARAVEAADRPRALNP